MVWCMKWNSKYKSDEDQGSTSWSIDYKHWNENLGDDKCRIWYHPHGITPPQWPTLWNPIFISNWNSLEWLLTTIGVSLYSSFISFLPPDICNIDRVSVSELSPARFESEYRYKKPVMVRFPRGAASWTDPDKWSRDSLVSAYSHWTIASGQSLEIVRKGGNAKTRTSFLQFLDTLLENNTSTQTEPQWVELL